MEGSAALLFRITVSGGLITMLVGSGSSWVVNNTGSTSVSDGKLHSIVMSKVGNDYELTLNGTSEITATPAGAVTPEIKYIGQKFNSAEFFDGIIANVKLTDLSTPSTTTFALDTATPLNAVEYSAENTFGSELVDNGWNTVTANVSALNQDVSFNAVDTSYIYAREPMALTIGKTYAAEVIISNYVSGSYTLQGKTGGTTVITSSSSSSGVFIFTPTVTTSTFEIGRSAGGVSIFDANISIREISNAVTYTGIALDERELFTLTDDGWLGEELVVNGDFATDSDWSKGTGWSIAGGVAVADGTNDAVSNLEQINILTIGDRVLATWGISSIIGTCRTYLGDATSQDNTTAGSKSFTGVVAGGTRFVQQARTTGFTGSIDNVSVKRILELP